MTLTASLSIPQPGFVPADQPDVQMMLVAGRLPDAPMAMPTQILEQKRTPFAFLKALFDGPLRPAGA
ncbi:MAG TPA: hypothetical protein PK450_04855 [Paracoccaceae bacterium]|nr:hypothetical protein [Paracoccaceae bacterium]